MDCCRVGIKMNGRLGARYYGRSFSPVGPAMLTVIPNLWVGMFDLDGYWLHGCITAHEPPPVTV